MGIYKQWEIHNLNNVNLQGEDDVTNTHETIANMLIIIWATFRLTPFADNIIWTAILLIFSFFLFSAPHIYILYHEKGKKLRDFFTKSTLKLLYKQIGQELRELKHLTIFFLAFTLFIPFFAPSIGNLLIFLAVAASYALIKLLYNRNFILYELLYRYRLKIKLITIEENLSPFSPILEQFEHIIIGLNRNRLENGKPAQQSIDFSDSIIFFWIRKDKEKSRTRSVQQFIPFLTLVTILYVLKEKSYKFVAIIGAYFSFVGLLFITFFSYMLQKIADTYHFEHATISFFTIASLVLWYLLTIYNIYTLIDISRYIKRINQTARRVRLKKEFNFNKGFSSILKTFDRDNAIYIYDYIFDKYLHVDSKFLSTHLTLSRKYVDRNIASLITVIISMVLVVFVEITANGVFQNNDINRTTTSKTYQYSPNSGTLQIIKMEEKSGAK